MPEHNQLSFGTPLSNAASRASGLDETATGLSRLSESLQICMDLWDRPEWGILRGEIPFSRFVLSPAVAARFSVIELTLAPTATVIAVIDAFILATTSTTYELEIQAGNAVAANPVTTRGLSNDTRYPQLGTTSQLVVTSGDTAAGTAFPQFRSAVNVVPSRPWAWILAPGGRLFVSNTVVNSALPMSFHWYERTPFPGERQARG